MITDGPILRIFDVRTKPNCTDTLLANFATTSADVVRHEPGNLGYFFGRSVEDESNTVTFDSVWENVDAIKQRFGDAWQVSFILDGYDDLIEHFSLRHVDATDGWHVSPAPENA